MLLRFRSKRKPPAFYAHTPLFYVRRASHTPKTRYVLQINAQRFYSVSQSPPQPSSSQQSACSTAPKIENKLSIVQRVKKEISHYVAGTKLLYMELKISSRLLRKLSMGTPLIRREKEQLRRTAGDLLRIVPFSVFMLVPFLEFALPIFIKLFPNMLPSTFKDVSKEEEKKLKQLKIKLEMARFLRDSLEQMSRGDRFDSQRATAARQLHTLFLRCRAFPRAPVSSTDLIRLGAAYGSAFSLDRFDRPLLVSICKYLGLRPIGTDSMLRGRIMRQMARIRTDDLEIRNEGISSLTDDELRHACQLRGIGHTLRVPPESLRHELDQWIRLHTLSDMPLAFFLLSRALSLHVGVERGIREALSQIDLSTLASTAPSSAAAVPASSSEEPSLGASPMLRRIQTIEEEERLIAEDLRTCTDLPVTDTCSRNPSDASVAETVATVKSIIAAVNDPVAREKQHLDRLHQDLADIRRLPEVDNRAQRLSAKLLRLIHDIDEDLKSVSQALPALTNAFDGGYLSEAEFDKLLKASPLDSVKVQKLQQAAVEFEIEKDNAKFVDAVKRIIQA